MGRDAVHLRKTWTQVDRPLAAGGEPFGLRSLTSADAPSLGRLMWAAFRGTLDDEGETLDDAEAEITRTLSGKWGSVIWPASLVAHVDDLIVSAAVAVFDNVHQERPLLAFVMTDPRYQRRGAGEQLIQECIRRLHAMGIRELHLAVTKGNPALSLYRRLGFEIVHPNGE